MIFLPTLSGGWNAQVPCCLGYKPTMHWIDTLSPTADTFARSRRDCSIMFYLCEELCFCVCILQQSMVGRPVTSSPPSLPHPFYRCLPLNISHLDGNESVCGWQAGRQSVWVCRLQLLQQPTSWHEYPAEWWGLCIFPPIVSQRERARVSAAGQWALFHSVLRFIQKPLRYLYAVGQKLVNFLECAAQRCSIYGFFLLLKFEMIILHNLKKYCNVIKLWNVERRYYCSLKCLWNVFKLRKCLINYYYTVTIFTVNHFLKD